MKNYWEKLSYSKKGFLVGIFLLVALYSLIVARLIGTEPAERLCLEAGWLDVSYRTCSLIEYVLTNTLFLIVYAWWLIVLIIFVPTILGFFIGKLKKR